MKNKVKTTEENYQEIMLKRAIITCWVLLAVCLVIKLFGGNFFNIICENKTFISVCNYIENSWIYCIFGFISFNLTNYFLFKCSNTLNKQKKSIKTIVIIFLELYWCFKALCDMNIITVNFIIYSITDIALLYISLCLYTKQPLRSLMSMILMLAFSMISAFVKNISIVSTMTNNALITFIFMIDYYIMFLLYYLYVKKFKRR